MRALNLQRLRELASLSDPEPRVTQAFNWHFERQKLILEVILASLTAVFVALLVAYLSGDISWEVALLVALVALGGLAVPGVRAYREAWSVTEDYLGALSIVDALKKSGPTERTDGDNLG